MMTNEVRCITIIHKKGEISRFRVFSAFFRLIGIFVYEKVYKEVSEEEALGMEVDEEECEMDTDAVISLVESDSPQNLDELLAHLNRCFGDSTMVWLKRIAKIYVLRNLMRGSYELDYFSDARDDAIYEDMMNSRDRFEVAYQQFCELEKSVAHEDDQTRKYIISAEANCMRRMNQLYMILIEAIEKGWYRNNPEKLRNELLTRDYYFHEDIEEKVMEILSIDPYYYGAHAILALADMTDDDSKVGAMDSFIRATKLIGEKPYASYLMFRMGRYYEYIIRRPATSLAYYKKAYQLEPNNFRAAFKIGNRAKTDGANVEAFKWMNRVIEILENKTDMRSIQPSECNYLYKAYKSKGKILLEEGMSQISHYSGNEYYLSSIKEFEKAISIYENDKDVQGKGSIYPFMFGDKATLYKAVARKKLHVWKTYDCIADAAARSDLYEKYKYASSMAEDLRDY